MSFGNNILRKLTGAAEYLIFNPILELSYDNG
jgi:hypothetical protein